MGECPLFCLDNVHGQLHASADVGGLDGRARAGEEGGEALLLLLRGEGAVVWGVCGGGGGRSSRGGAEDHVVGDAVAEGSAEVDEVTDEHFEGWLFCGCCF